MTANKGPSGSPKPTTEASSHYHSLESLSTKELLEGINQEDQKVASVVAAQLDAIESVVDQVHLKMSTGGRLFYIGAGTSGRLGVVDASEIPPTFGLPHDRVIGLIAGGDAAIRKAVEFAEDDQKQAWQDLLEHEINEKDFLLGLAASGSTPYVVGGVMEARANGISTACITCNADSRLSQEVDYSIEVVVGPEFVTGSTRMKSGTAQKMVLNMISTGVMIKLGRVKGNRMTYMQLSNDKLVKRGVNMIVEALGVTENEAKELLDQYGNVNSVLSNY